MRDTTTGKSHLNSAPICLILWTLTTSSTSFSLWELKQVLGELSQTQSMTDTITVRSDKKCWLKKDVITVNVATTDSHSVKLCWLIQKKINFNSNHLTTQETDHRTNRLYPDLYFYFANVLEKIGKKKTLDCTGRCGPFTPFNPNFVSYQKRQWQLFALENANSIERQENRTVALEA